jgi:glyoxylase-like metal-dependent hydrolase (beta-lactamase superfamily II)
MRIGAYELHAIETGEFALDGGAMFGIIPKVLWEKKIPADDKNRISLRLRALLISGNGRNILVDDGIGNKDDEKFSSIYKVDHSRFTLESSLSKHRLTCNDVTDVILTHFHFDHAGGSTRIDKDGKIVPTFPNATYYIQKKNLKWAKDPSEKDQASYTKENFEPLIEARLLKELDGPCELYPGITILVAEGHTPAQQIVKITDGKTTLVYCGDLIPTSAHVPIPWVMGYDNHPITTLDEKRKILEQALEEKWILFFEHCPLMAACRVVKTKKGFECGETVEL